MVAGPNGAGKTTMARELIDADTTSLYEFLNADEIARGLAPLHPESMNLTASKLMILQLKEMLANYKNFAFETTGSGTNFIKHLRNAKAQNYTIHLTFLYLESPDQAIQRVEQRVIHGGHHIPEETIIRRYYSGIKNLLEHYLPLADSALIIDNSSEQKSNRLIARKYNSCPLDIINKKLWGKMEEDANGRS